VAASYGITRLKKNECCVVFEKESIVEYAIECMHLGEIDGKVIGVRRYDSERSKSKER
jgi:RNA recognition motif-containing protein